MQYRRLGQNGPEIPVIGFGGWPIGEGMGSVDEKTALRTVRAALEQGLTLIDTAQAYKSSETRIGKVIKDYDRDHLFVATKVSFDMNSDGVEKALENSLRSLGSDYVDLYQVHWWNEEPPVEETLEAMVKLQEQGKIRYIGVSNFTVDQMKRALKVAPVISNQINYNMFLRTAEQQLIPFCKEKGIGIMVHSTLAKGFLAGKYTREHTFSSDDERSEFSQYQGEVFHKYLDAVDDLKEIAAEKGWTLIELAIAWVLRNEEVTTALVGMKKPEQIEVPLKGGDRVLTGEDQTRIEAVLDKHNLENLSPFGWQIV
jgi:aryl-alcohol dehydrogenase-like predicted oxidoreductase